jgi:hypothetical protein
MNVALTKAALLNGTGRKLEAVKLPELGGFVYVRGLTVPELALLADKLATLDADKQPAECTAVHLAAFVCDEDGQAVLTFEEAMQFVASKTHQIPARIVSAGTRLNSMDMEAIDKAAGE